MKAKLLSPVVLVSVILILAACLTYQSIRWHHAARNLAQYQLALSVSFYQTLERGEVETLQRRLGALVTSQSEYYERRFGQNADPKFAPRLSEAQGIRDAHRAKLNQSK